MKLALKISNEKPQNAQQWQWSDVLGLSTEHIANHYGIYEYNQGDMKELKNDTIKYMLLLLGISIVNFLLNIFLIEVIDFHQFEDAGKAHNLIIQVALILLNLIFGLILFVDCRKDMKNRYLIPILGAIVPIVGLMFYFIERYTLAKVCENDK